MVRLCARPTSGSSTRCGKRYYRLPDAQYMGGGGYKAVIQAFKLKIKAKKEWAPAAIKFLRYRQTPCNLNVQTPTSCTVTW